MLGKDVGTIVLPSAEKRKQRHEQYRLVNQKTRGIELEYRV
jgi:glutamate 5-kinase